jgi:hypothetical protein
MIFRPSLVEVGCVLTTVKARRAPPTRSLAQLGRRQPPELAGGAPAPLAADCQPLAPAVDSGWWRRRRSGTGWVVAFRNWFRTGTGHAFSGTGSGLVGQFRRRRDSHQRLAPRRRRRSRGTWWQTATSSLPPSRDCHQRLAGRLRRRPSVLRHHVSSLIPPILSTTVPPAVCHRREMLAPKLSTRPGYGSVSDQYFTLAGGSLEGLQARMAQPLVSVPRVCPGLEFLDFICI